MVITRNPEAAWTEIEESVFILSLVNGRYYELKGVGSFLWRALDEPMDRSALASRVAARYTVSSEQCEADLDRFIDSLKAVQLVSETAA